MDDQIQDTSDENCVLEDKQILTKAFYKEHSAFLQHTPPLLNYALHLFWRTDKLFY